MKNKLVIKDNGPIPKEFIPILFILATPTLAFMNGFGIKTVSIGIDVFYIAAVLFGLIMIKVDKIKILNLYDFILLIVLEISVNIPCMKYDNYFNGNFTYLVISYALIVLFYIYNAYSFMVNDPYFVSYYRSQNKIYISIYRIIGLFFVGIAIFHVYLFTKIIEILMITVHHS